MSNEAWQDIPEFPSYRASDQGRIGSCLIQSGPEERWVHSSEIVRILKPSYDKRGYAQVNLYRDGKCYTKKIATLVMLAFCGPPPVGLEICHGNNDPTDNWLCNLRYDTHQANMQESMLVGRASRKLTLEQAEAIRIEYARGNTSKAALARKNEVSPYLIVCLLHGITYADAGGPILLSDE